MGHLLTPKSFGSEGIRIEVRSLEGEAEESDGLAGDGERSNSQTYWSRASGAVQWLAGKAHNCLAWPEMALGEMTLGAMGRPPASGRQPRRLQRRPMPVTGAFVRPQPCI